MKKPKRKKKAKGLTYRSIVYFWPTIIKGDIKWSDVTKGLP